jgi:hypothetical protein
LINHQILRELINLLLNYNFYMKSRYCVNKSMKETINSNLIQIDNNRIMEVNNQKNLLDFLRLL